MVTCNDDGFHYFHRTQQTSTPGELMATQTFVNCPSSDPCLYVPTIIHLNQKLLWKVQRVNCFMREPPSHSYVAQKHAAEARHLDHCVYIENPNKLSELKTFEAISCLKNFYLINLKVLINASLNILVYSADTF